MPDSRGRSIAAIAISLAALVVIVGGLWPQGETVRTDAQRADHSASRLRCPFCNGESIAEATSQVARDLEAVIGEQVAAGMTDEQIYYFFAERYGETLLLDPPLIGWGWALWVLPLGALAVGGVAVARRKRRSQVVVVPIAGSLEAARVREQLDSVSRDQAEVAVQRASGELDDGTVTTLVTALDEEARTLTSVLAESEGRGSPPPSPARSRRAGAGIAVVVLGAVAIGATLLLTDGNGGDGGIVDAPPIDLASITSDRLEEVVAANPDVVPMRMILAQILMDEGEVARAAVHFGEVLQREENSEAMAWLDWIDAIGEPPGPARTARLERVAGANPEIVQMQLALGKELAESDELLKAAEQFGGVLEKEQNPEAMAWIGWIGFQVGEFESAEAFLVDALALAPNYELAQWWLANVRLIGLGDAAGAVAPLEALIDSDGLPEDLRRAAEEMLRQAREQSS